MKSYYKIDKNTRLKHGYYFPALGKCYQLQRKECILFFIYWKTTAWAYHKSIDGCDIFESFDDMIEWLYWKESKDGYYKPYF